jgi:Cu(I)/Ag(I) efflux system membrane fusion protein
MKPSATTAIIAVLVAAALGGGYWLGARRPAEPVAAIQQTDKSKPQPKILYYRNPMGLPDTSPTPKKDSMGMDYIPVYEGEEPETGQVKISTEKIQKLGVKTEAAAPREIARIIRVVGTLQADERRLHTVAPKFEGWIERLHANTTGQAVARGQALMEVYSPELVSAQQEYAIAWQGVQSLRNGSTDTKAGMQQLAESALQRLRNWDISPEQVERLRKDGKPQRTLMLASPVNGVVLEKPAVQGMRFMPGEVLYRIADLSSLWLLAEIAEQDLALVRVGQAARIAVNAYPAKVFEGKVTFVSPTLNPQTRTAQVRIELPNAGNLLKPAMYANVELPSAAGRGKVLAVPASAVLDSGTRQVALVEIAEGRFEPREVKVGRRSDDYLEILEGIGEGEKVVVGANFLIDAESNLKAALGSFGGHEGHGAKVANPPQPPFDKGGAEQLPEAGGAPATHGEH